MRFNEILLLITLITGLIWLFDSIFFRPKRMMHVIPGKHRAEVGEPWWVEYSRSFFPILLIVLLLRAFVLEPFRIPSGSMRPTLLEGDFIVVNKFTYGLHIPFIDSVVIPIGDPKRGDVIVFKHDKKDDSMDMIKRVVGLPGDHIQYLDKVIYVNGVPVNQDFKRDVLDTDPVHNNSVMVRLIDETLGNVKHDIYVRADGNSHSYSFTDVTVPDNKYFVMGDNRDNSGDSRVWGYVDRNEILGRALGIWFSWDATQCSWYTFWNCIRWNRIGNGLGTNID